MNADEKACPYCAEMIKAAAVKCRYCGSDLSVEPSPTNSAEAHPTIAACSSCNVALVPVTKKASVSVAGIFGVLLFLAGAVAMFVNLVAGLVMIVVGIVVSITGRGSRTSMVCPRCGSEAPPEAPIY